MARIAMTRRTAALVAAVALAAVATVALFSYVQGERDRAIGEGQVVEVFVAKEAIPAGMSVENATARGLITREIVPERLVALGAVRSLEEIQGQVATVEILAGEQILIARFGTAGQVRTPGALSIPEGRQAMSVQVGLVPGVAGFVQPGDRISILAQLEVPVGSQTESRVQFVLQGIEVLQVGRRTTVVQEDTAAPQDSVLVTVAVTAAQAERLAFAIFQGQLYFTLLPEGQAVAPTTGRIARNVFP